MCCRLAGDESMREKKGAMKEKGRTRNYVLLLSRCEHVNQGGQDEMGERTDFIKGQRSEETHSSQVHPKELPFFKS